MNFFEAMEALKDGKKIRRKEWDKPCFIHLNCGILVNHNKCVDTIVCSTTFVDCWELFQESKSKVKRWKWLVWTKEPSGRLFPWELYLWMTEEEIKKDYGARVIKPWAGPEEFDE